MKTLVITGASKGIGLAAARLFLEAGYHAINLSRTPSPAIGIDNHLIDLSLEEAQSQLDALFNKLLQPGEIVLVHNAAKLVNDTADATTTGSLKDVLQINVMVPHLINQLVITKMKPGSSIIYLGSTLSEKAVANTYSYVVSKHAVAGMMRSTCQDLAGTGIHSCCICPGFTNTEMLRTHVGEDKAILAGIASLSTFGRLVEPEEIAAAILFAAGNPVINGSMIHANLGQIET